MSMSFKIFTKKCQLIPEATEQPVMEVDQNGSKVWYLNGNLHRTDGPAMVYADGTKSWYINGVKHRTDGPAFESVYGTKEWWVNGNRHRLNGPAVKYTSRYQLWYVDDIFIFAVDKGGKIVNRLGK